MNETKLKIEKGSEYGGTGILHCRQAKLIKFICKKKNNVGRC